MEIFLGAMIILAWLAIIIWGAAALVIQAKRRKDWGKVGIAALSATTVAGPLLTLMPEHDLPFGGQTMGLGFILAIISAVTILACCMAFHRLS
jgi:uncharacterized membrane protein YhaH (DUF805 family)